MQAPLPPIVVGADHAAYQLKERIADHLRSKGYTVEDVGCYSEASVDYPAIAQTLATKMKDMETASGVAPKGVLCCGSGIGIMISANRFPWIRAAVCHDHFAATMSRRHNDTNVISFGARVIAPDLALELLDAWLETEFEGERHRKRVDMMANLDIDVKQTARGAAAPC